jgi:hypothetical protein
MFEQRGYRQSRATEAPCSGKLPWGPVDSGAKRPVHGTSLSLIGRKSVDSRYLRDARPRRREGFSCDGQDLVADKAKADGRGPPYSFAATQRIFRYHRSLTVAAPFPGVAPFPCPRYPRTSSCVRRNVTRTQPAVGWPNVVAGWNWVNSSELPITRFNSWRATRSRPLGRQ